MKFKLLLVSFSVLAFLNAKSQIEQSPIKESSNSFVCGTENPPESWNTWFNAKVEEQKQKNSANKTQQTSITIPVIVHVIHGGSNVGTYPNISQAQIKSQITVLNDDFAGLGYNVSQLATKGFSTVGAANCMVNFCLAEFDPNGMPLAEPGIERINYVTKGWTNPASPTTNSSFKSLIDGTIKPNTIWDPTFYFNIWVTDVNSSVNLLGYATFPGGSNLSGITTALGTASTDGVWCYARSFGSTGTLLSGYNLGRTATHEVGHWLGLRHIGGDAANSTGDCNATDYCDDTPSQRGGYAGGSNGQNFGNPPYPLNANVCGSIYGDMYMNFMDYTYDYSKYMFTPDQALRVQTALENGYFRNQLNASSATQCSGKPSSDFSIDSIVCVGTEVNILNLSEGSAITYSWTVLPDNGAAFSPTHTSASPKLYYIETGTYTITLVTKNANGFSTAKYEQQVIECTGLSEKTKKSGISVFPNPSSGILSVNTQNIKNTTIRYSVVNAVGSVVASGLADTSKVQAFQLDLSGFSNGIYALILNLGNEEISERIVIQH